MQMNSDVSKVRRSLYTETNLLLIYLSQNADTRTYQRYQSVRTAVFILVRMKSDGVRSLEDSNVTEAPTVSMIRVIFSTEHSRSIWPSELTSDSIPFIDLSLLSKTRNYHVRLPQN
jgi:hypothetical protein